MNLSKNLVNSLSLGTLVTGLSLTVALNTSGIPFAYAATPAVLDGNSNGYQCEGGSSNRWKIETGSEATLPNGYSFAKVVVKAGGNCVEVYPTNTASTCYSININGTTVSVTKIGTGSSCKDISHLEGTYSVSQTTPTVTPTPTPTCTETPTPTPTDTVTPTPTDTPTPTPTGTTCPQDQNLVNGICIHIDCPGGGTCEVIIGDTPTPTPTATNTPTPTPTTGSSNNNSSIVQSASGSNNDSKPAEVAAPTMAATGGFSTLLSNASMLAGVILSTLALKGYEKKKKK